MSSMIDLRCVPAALAAGLLAAACAAWAFVERDLAEAQHQLAAANLDAAERGYARVGDYLRRVGRIPWVLPGVQAEIAARRAAIRYWQGDHASLLQQRAGEPSVDSRPGVDVRLAVANATYRTGQRPGASREEVLDSLDRAIGLYAALLQDDGNRPDIAFNYELLLRRRKVLAGGGQPLPAGPESPLGREGGQPLDDDTGLDDIQIYVPLNQDERDRIDDPTMGGDPPLQRRG